MRIFAFWLILAVLAAPVWAGVESREVPTTRTETYLVCDACGEEISKVTWGFSAWGLGNDSGHIVIAEQGYEDTLIPCLDGRPGCCVLHYGEPAIVDGKTLYAYCDMACLIEAVKAMLMPEPADGGTVSFDIDGDKVLLHNAGTWRTGMLEFVDSPGDTQ